MAGALESQTNTNKYLLGILTGTQVLRKEEERVLYCLSGLRANFAKFSCENCAKIVLNQVSWQAKSWASAAIPGRRSIASITCLEKLCKVQFGTCFGLKKSPAKFMQGM